MQLRKLALQNPLLVSCLLLASSLSLLSFLLFQQKQEELERNFEAELRRKAALTAMSFLSGLSGNEKPVEIQAKIEKLVRLTPEIEEISYFAPYNDKFRIVASSNSELINLVEKTEPLEKAWQQERSLSVMERRRVGRGSFSGISITFSPSSAVERIFDGVFPVFFPGERITALLHLRFSFLDVDYQFSAQARNERRGFALLGISIFSLFLFFGFWANRMTNKASLLSETTRAKDELLSFAAHELSAPLANIKGSLSLILEEKDLEMPKKLITIGERALVSVEQLVALVEDLLTVSRFERGKIEIYPRPLHLEEIYKLVFSQFKKQIEEKGLKLVYRQPSPPLPKVVADPDKIREVLTNLLSNALKYTEKGTITLSGEAGRKEVVTKVTDTGVGIPQEELPKLFTRFGRIRGKISAKGTGLGLYITRLIVEAHHGKIWAESTEGKGSVFLFSLPIPKKG